MAEEITPENGIPSLKELFARAGKPDGKYRTAEEQFNYLSRDGAQRFKRKAMGLCGRITDKSLDEFAEHLTETGIASSMEEGRLLVPKIVQANKSQQIHRGNSEILSGFVSNHLSFDEVRNSSGDLKYRLYSGSTVD